MSETISWPTVGTNARISRADLTEYQRHDPEGREWIAAVIMRRVGDDKQFEDWYGPVVEDANVIAGRVPIDVGFGAGRLLWVDLGRDQIVRAEA